MVLLNCLPACVKSNDVANVMQREFHLLLLPRVYVRCTTLAHPAANKRLRQGRHVSRPPNRRLCTITGSRKQQGKCVPCPLLRRDGGGMARCVLQFGAGGDRRIKSVVNEEWRTPDLKLLTPNPQPVPLLQ